MWQPSPKIIMELKKFLALSSDVMAVIAYRLALTYQVTWA